MDEKNPIKVIISKANEIVGVIKKIELLLYRKALLTLYKYFVKSHLYYEDIIYDKQNNKSFCDKRETVQYNAALDLTSSILGSSKVKL